MNTTLAVRKIVSSRYEAQLSFTPSFQRLCSFLGQDPLDDEFHHAWNETARINAEVYQELFHCTPAKGVKTWDDYAKWVPAGKKVGHIHNQENLELGYIKQRLSQIRGHVVEMPTGEWNGFRKSFGGMSD